MIKSFLAYDISDLESMHILSKSKNLFNNGILEEEQWNTIKEKYPTRIYAPPLYIKLPLFIISTLGLLFSFGLISFIMEFSGFQIQALIMGPILLLLTDKILIRSSFHFSSGVSETGIYFGFILLAIGLFGESDVDPIWYLFTGLFFTLIITIRYLDVLALIASLFCIGAIIFRFTSILGGLAEALLPFILMSVFIGLFLFSSNYEQKRPEVIFKNQLIVAKSVSLLVIYLAVNYYVVRELSIELMGLNLTDNQDIPFAFIFYVFTLIIPFGYIIWGIKKKSILFIRIGILTALLTGITFYTYFFSDYTIYVITISGAILILVTILLFKKLKLNELGFTSEKVMDDSWRTNEIGMIMASKINDNDQSIPPKKNDW